MLVGFSVSNYKSFKETQSISFVASKITRHKEHVAIRNNRRILKSGLIFGANAGGKSNLVKAIRFSREIIVNGLDHVNLNKRYFRIINEIYTVPGVFEYRIMIGNVEYSYGIAVSYSKKVVLSEWLVRISDTGEEIYLLNRVVGEDGISHATSEARFANKAEQNKMDFYLEGFDESISDAYKKKSILSDIALRANEKEGVFAEIKKIYKWFDDMIILFPTSKYNGLNEVAANDHKKEFFSALMKFFDTGIDFVGGESKEMDFDKILYNIPRSEAEKIKVDISNAASESPIMFKVDEQIFELHKDEDGNIVYNKLLLDHGNSDDKFEYADESDGTKRLFDLIPLYYESAESVILIDEIDRSFHTNLTRKFLELFYDLTANEDCQLIATTHDSNLLDLDLLRQDEIWFVERQEDHASKVFSLNLFKERFDKKIEKEYLLGRYGAIPIFDDKNILEEICEK